jgi:hypothetical protein
MLSRYISTSVLEVASAADEAGSASIHIKGQDEGARRAVADVPQAAEKIIAKWKTFVVMKEKRSIVLIVCISMVALPAQVDIYNIRCFLCRKKTSQHFPDGGRYGPVPTFKIHVVLPARQCRTRPGLQYITD